MARLGEITPSEIRIRGSLLLHYHDRGSSWVRSMQCTHSSVLSFPTTPTVGDVPIEDPLALVYLALVGRPLGSGFQSRSDAPIFCTSAHIHQRNQVRKHLSKMFLGTCRRCPTCCSRQCGSLPWTRTALCFSVSWAREAFASLDLFCVAAASLPLRRCSVRGDHLRAEPHDSPQRHGRLMSAEKEVHVRLDRHESEASSEMRDSPCSRWKSTGLRRSGTDFALAKHTNLSEMEIFSACEGSLLEACMLRDCSCLWIRRTRVSPKRKVQLAQVELLPQEAGLLVCGLRHRA